MTIAYSYLRFSTPEQMRGVDICFGATGAQLGLATLSQLFASASHTCFAVMTRHSPVLDRSLL